MKFTSNFTKFKLVLFGHILNPLWYSRAKRRKIRTNYILKTVDRYFQRYLHNVQFVKEQKVIKNDDGEKIFTLWLQGEDNAPDIVKSCFRSVRRHCKQELIILDANTIFDYISLPDEIVAKYRAGKIGHAHFADICRVELLYRHGGYWLDATGFVTEPIPKFITDSDFFMFLVNPEWDFGYSFVQNCFIRARKGDYLLAAWRAMILDYWMHEDHELDYFMHQLLFKTLVVHDERAKKHFEKMPHVLQDGTHMLWWGHKDEPFDKKRFKEITKDAFFQKTTFRGLEVVPGSFADEMIKMK